MLRALGQGSVIADWLDNDVPEEVFAAAKTDAQGQFALEQPLERTVAYPFIIAAKGTSPSRMTKSPSTMRPQIRWC